MRATKGNPISTPLRELHDASGRDLREVAEAMGLRSVEHYHMILRRGTEKYSVLEKLAQALDVPVNRVAEAAQVTREHYTKTKSYQMACT